MLQNGKKLKGVYSVHSGNAARRWACVFASSDGAAHFNDALGTTLGVRSAGGYAPTPHTAFGDVPPLGVAGTSPSTVAGRSSADAVAASALPATFFTGKPRVAGLGHAFLLRNYRADLSRWPTLDPLGYPDGWNGFAYCMNDVMARVDFCGASTLYYYYYVGGLYYYAINDLFAPEQAVSEVNSFQDALNHYRSGEGGCVSAGSGLISEMCSPDSFVNGEKSILDVILGKLQNVPWMQFSGFVNSAPGSYRGYRCLTLGSYRLNIEYSAEWFSDAWIVEADGRKSRNVWSNFTIDYFGYNDWDFEWNEEYSIWNNISQELIPGAIAGSVGNPKSYRISYEFSRNYYLSVKQYYE